MRRSRSLDAAYFEELYGREIDPWSLETSEYEAGKYQRTLAALGDERSKRALELGCSIGVLTRKLAAHCDRLIATDISKIALERAGTRCADLPNVELMLVRSARDSFVGEFDLIVLSEVVYFWDDADLAAVAEAILRTLEPGGRLLLVHWLGETDYPRSGDDAVAALEDVLSGTFSVERSERHDAYRLDLWRRLAGLRSPSR
jgi:SAM-dependent methyltransferase